MILTRAESAPVEAFLNFPCHRINIAGNSGVCPTTLIRCHEFGIIRGSVQFSEPLLDIEDKTPRQLLVTEVGAHAVDTRLQVCAMARESRQLISGNTHPTGFGIHILFTPRGNGTVDQRQQHRHRHPGQTRITLERVGVEPPGTQLFESVLRHLLLMTALGLQSLLLILQKVLLEFLQQLLAFELQLRLLFRFMFGADFRSLHLSLRPGSALTDGFENAHVSEALNFRSEWSVSTLPVGVGYAHAIVIAPHVSAADLVGCRYRQVQRQSHPEIPRTRAAAMRRARSDAARAAVHARLPLGPSLGDRRRFLRTDVAPLQLEEDTFSAELDTLEALAARADLVTGAVFTGISDGIAWRVDMDLLVRRPDDTYLPVVISNHRVARADARATATVIATARLGLGEPVEAPFRLRHHVADGYRLAFAARALAEIGLDSGLGAAIGQDRSRAFLAPTAPLQPALDAALATELPTGPRHVKECATCRFWPLCEADLRATDDISLYLRGDRARDFRERGIDTVAGLIDAGLGEASELAAAWRAGTVLLRRVDTVTAPATEAEIDVDMEAYLDQGAYLWGAFDGEDYHPFATWVPLGGDAEAENFARFWRWLMGRREQARAEGRSFAAYCWSNNGENHWLKMSARRFAGRVFGDVTVPTEAEVQKFISSDEWVDVFRVVRSQLAGPSGLGLKVVAPEAGYTWADGDFDGEESINARRISRGSDAAAMQARAQLLRYNEDDCRATAAVRHWLRAGAPGVPRLGG